MTSHVGLAMASAMPGNPAPLPTSMTRILAPGRRDDAPASSARSMAGMSARESATCLPRTSSTVSAPVRFMTLFFSRSVVANVRTRSICASSRYDSMIASVSTSAAADARARRR